MNKLRKKALSLLLVIVMIVSLFPAAAWAVEAPTPSVWVQGKIDALTAQGYTASNSFPLADSDLYYYILTKNIISDDGKLSQDAVFIIQPGKNATNASMPNYNSSEDDQPWAGSNPSAIYIADGVTGIGNHAFSGCFNLREMEIEDPGDLTRVGEYAFYGCSRLSYTEANPLNLSAVTEIGRNAFSGCNSLRAVTLGEGLKEIPQYAFNSCGLLDIDIPSTVTSIGGYAFAYNSFSSAGELVLPEGLKTIGNYAFYREVGSSKNSGFTAVSIPSTVTSIGDYAFYAHRRLETITVQGSNTGASNSQLTTVGDAAFGTDNYSAYAEHTTITDAVRPDITYTGEIGTTINLPKEIADKNLFINGDTCYTGDITPLTYFGKKDPTCTEDGYDEYTMTISNASAGGQNIEMTYRYPILALGHDWGGISGIKEMPASCTRDGYFYQICSRCQMQTDVTTDDITYDALYDDNGDKLSDEKLAEYRAQIEKQTGHNYVPYTIDNNPIAAEKTTTLHY